LDRTQSISKLFQNSIKAKNQLPYYFKFSLKECLYIVFIKEKLKNLEGIEEATEIINGQKVITRLVYYDAEKW